MRVEYALLALGEQTRSFVFLFVLQLSFFLLTKLGLLLFLSLAFVFTSLVTHAVRPPVIEKVCCGQMGQTGFTFSALGPFGPCPSVYDTRCPSWSCS